MFEADGPGGAVALASPPRAGDGEVNGWRSPGAALSGDLDAAVQAVGSAAQGARTTGHLLSTAEVAGGLGRVDELTALVESTRVLLVAQGLSRGLPSEAGLSERDWATQRCPGLPARQISDVVTVAQAMAEPIHAGVTERVIGRALPVSRAAAVLRALARVRPALDHDGYDRAMDTLLDVATSARFTDTDLRRVTDHLLSVVLPDREHDARDQAARDLRGVHESSLADGSLIRFIVTCDPEGAAVFRAVVSSPLAAPAPDETEPDPRSGTQRRYDALLTVLRRGVRGGDQMPTTPAAMVTITMAYDALTRELTGTGTTSTGETLAPATVRRLACDADLIPVVLGTHREILDMGRARRLVTPGQRRALHHRDKRCTFPGCTTPAPWCDAHHVVHWSRGGRSDLSNYALLCGRHHTLVHAHDHTATVTTTGVTWHV